MSELRWHPFLREWVITATHRQERTFFPPDDYCPLCPTRSEGVPTEIPRNDYEIAVFENRFPSLSNPPPGPAIEPSKVADVRPSVGICEVVCYSPSHTATLADLSAEQVRRLVRVWKERYMRLSALPEIAYVYIFENKGKEIGVTLSHPHGQIYAYPFVPRVIQTRLDAEQQYFLSTGRRLIDDWIADEMADGRRIVYETPRWVCVVPLFARYPYEVHIAPKFAAADLRALDDAALDGLADALQTITRKYDRLFGFSMPYIMSIFQFHADYTGLVVEFTPPYRTADKLKYLAGSEAGCGVFINDTLPEETAEQLRLL